ncbi:MAG TPA: hydrogenase 4 subunit B, partial [Azonexus sp.]|nr:hydrogenase 4 subunit B [Azonexus sp.]
MLTWLVIDWVLFAVATWLAIGLAGVLALRQFAFVARVLFPLGGMACLLVAYAGLQGVGGTPEVAILPIGLPQLPFHLRFDSLAAFFLLVIGAVGAGISIFAAGYFRKGEG